MPSSAVVKLLEQRFPVRIFDLVKSRKMITQCLGQQPALLNGLGVVGHKIDVIISEHLLDEGGFAKPSPAIHHNKGRWMVAIEGVVETSLFVNSVYKLHNSTLFISDYNYYVLQK